MRNDENNGFSLFIHPFYSFPLFLPSFLPFLEGLSREKKKKKKKEKKIKYVGKVVGQVLIKLDRIFGI